MVDFDPMELNHSLTANYLTLGPLYDCKNRPDTGQDRHTKYEKLKSSYYFGLIIQLVVST